MVSDASALGIAHMSHDRFGSVHAIHVSGQWFHNHDRHPILWTIDRLAPHDMDQNDDWHARLVSAPQDDRDRYQAIDDGHDGHAHSSSKDGQFVG
jgi:hypothetical protein